MNEPLSTPAPYAWVKGDYEIIIDLERQLADVKAQLAERTRERDEARIELNRIHANELPGGWTGELEGQIAARHAAMRALKEKP